MSVSVPRTDTQGDVRSDLFLIFVEMIIVPMVGKPIIKRRFPLAVATRFPTARFCVYLATKRPALTVDTDF